MVTITARGRELGELLGVDRPGVLEALSLVHRLAPELARINVERCNGDDPLSRRDPDRWAEVLDSRERWARDLIRRHLVGTGIAAVFGTDPRGRPVYLRRKDGPEVQGDDLAGRGWGLPR